MFKIPVSRNTKHCYHTGFCKQLFFDKLVLKNKK